MYSLLVIVVNFKVVHILVDATSPLFLPLSEVLPELTAWYHMSKSRNFIDILVAAVSFAATNGTYQASRESGG
jgi:hypothetical protein